MTGFLKRCCNWARNLWLLLVMQFRENTGLCRFPTIQRSILQQQPLSRLSPGWDSSGSADQIRDVSHGASYWSLIIPTL